MQADKTTKHGGAGTLDDLRLWSRPLQANPNLLMCVFCSAIVPYGRRTAPTTQCGDCGFNGSNGPELLSKVWDAYAWTDAWRHTYKNYGTEHKAPTKHNVQRGRSRVEVKSNVNRGADCDPDELCGIRLVRVPGASSDQS